MLSDIYNHRILELAGNIPRLGRLEDPQATARVHSKLCGSTIVADLSMTDGRVSAFAQDVKACALGAVRAQVRAMLKAGGPPPDGAWAEAAVLEPVRDYTARHASTLLSFEAAAQAASEVEAREAEAVPARSAAPSG